MIKARFGEANIQSCDVMLKDILESKRVDRLIHARGPENVISLTFKPKKKQELTIDCSSKDPFQILLATITR